MKKYKKIIFLFLLINLIPSFNLKAQEQEPDPPRKKIDWSKYITEKSIIEYRDNAPKIIKSKTKLLPFKNLKYNRVIAYDFEGSEGAFRSITSEEGHFIYKVTKQKGLNQKQSDQIVEILTSKKTYGSRTATCFNPHMAIVFFNDNEIVFKVDICLDCNYLESSQEIPAMKSKKVIYETGNVYFLEGFSKKGVTGIRNLAKELDLFYGN